MRALRQERGMVLLLVLVVVALLTGLIVEFTFSTLVSMRLAETFRDSTRAYYLAKGGLRAGMMILRDDRNGYDAPDEPWAQGVAGYPVGEGLVSIEIEDLDGRLDLNRLVDQLGNANAVFRDRFLHLLELVGAEDPEGLTNALIDWLDPDGDPRPRGAETAYYQGLERPYPCRNGTLDSLDELSLVKGFTPEVQKLLRPHVTVHGGDRLNVNTATVEVMAAYFQGGTVKESEALVAAERVVDLRRGAPIRSLQPLKEMGEMENLGFVINTYLTVTSGTFRVRSRGAVNDGARTVEGIVRRASSGADQLLYQKVY